MNAPVITALVGSYGTTWADRWDLNGTLTFDAGGLPAADMEIWLCRSGVDPGYSLWGTFSSAQVTFTVDHICEASAEAITYLVKLRFNNYTDAPGPFSTPLAVILNTADSFSLVKEAGAGLSNSNSYASVDDGDLYHAGHLYASAWTGATVEKKTAALVMATKLIDAEYQFNGGRSEDSQALQWPRVNCTDPDKAPTPVFARLLLYDTFVAYDSVPKAVVEATCELARELIIADRTAAPRGEGLKYENVGSTQTGYDKTDTRPIIPAVVQALLAKFGSLINAKSGSVKLLRV